MTLATAEKTSEMLLCRLHLKKVHTSTSLPALCEVFSKLKAPSILGANPSRANADRFSYFAAQPKDMFVFHSGQKDPFAKLQKALDKYTLDQTPSNLPNGLLPPGWIGYFAYEIARFIETLPESTTDDLNLPLIRLCFYDRLIAYDHSENSLLLLALQMPNDIEQPRQKLDNLNKLLLKAQKISVPAPPPADIENIDFSQIQSNMDRHYYLNAVEKIKRDIYDGNVYQVNFSQRFQCDYNAGPIDLFHWQNHYNPSPYSAYIDAGDFSIISASPEMFVTIRDNIISTKPIKGTRPRLTPKPECEKTNRKNFTELLNNQKERAELNMIIDLERNDLARICKPGTRKVTQPRTIETYPTVFHAVATVAGQLREKIRFSDILKTIFPGGSITGAPKISSMKIIDRTEPTARSVYTGSMGLLALNGAASLNIAIRTVIIKNHKAYAQTGGGIVADSDPNAEWNETITKARALLAGIKAVQCAK